MSKKFERIPVNGKQFGKVLQRIRQEKNLTQEDLAYAMKIIWEREKYSGRISSGFIKGIENGTVQSVSRLRISVAAEALAVPITRLLSPEVVLDEVPPTTDADIVLALRGYGLSDPQIEEILQQLHRSLKD